jgi:hypothetical protein
VIPADALVTTTTTVSPDPVVTDGILDEPIDVPPPPTEVQLPNPAPRGAC